MKLNSKKLCALITTVFLTASTSHVFANNTENTYTGFVLYTGDVIAEVNGNYKLTCYYDKPESQGGRIRVITAHDK